MGAEAPSLPSDHLPTRSLNVGRGVPYGGRNKDAFARVAWLDVTIGRRAPADPTFCRVRRLLRCLPVGFGARFCVSERLRLGRSIGKSVERAERVRRRVP